MLNISTDSNVYIDSSIGLDNLQVGVVYYAIDECASDSYIVLLDTGGIIRIDSPEDYLFVYTDKSDLFKYGFSSFIERPDLDLNILLEKSK